MVREHDKVGIQVLLAAPPTSLCKALTRHGFFKRFSSERLFPSVTSGINFARDGNMETKWLAKKILLCKQHYWISTGDVFVVSKKPPDILLCICYDRPS